MEKSRLRVIIWNEFKRGNTAAETFRIINENEGKNVVSYATVTRWFAKFRVDDEKLEDKPRAGRPSKLDKDALRRKIEDDPHITIRELEELLNCGKSTIGDHLKAMGMVKKLDKWVPHNLTDLQKAKRRCASEKHVHGEIHKNNFCKMSSGVNVHADCQTTFQQLSEGKRSLRYIIYKIEGKDVVVESAVTPEDLGVTGDDHDDNSKAAYEQFVKDLKDRTTNYEDCRYAVFDFKFTCPRPGAGISKVDKIIFIQLCPDGASIKKKMVYASSASAIKQALGTAKFLQIQASDESEISHSEILNSLLNKFRDN